MTDKPLGERLALCQFDQDQQGSGSRPLKALEMMNEIPESELVN